MADEPANLEQVLKEIERLNAVLRLQGSILRKATEQRDTAQEEVVHLRRVVAQDTKFIGMAVEQRDAAKAALADAWQEGYASGLNAVYVDEPQVNPYRKD